jgi:hypothetical protein
MKKLLFLLVLLTSFIGYSQVDTLQTEKIDIEIDALVKYSGDNGTILLDRETPRLFEIKTKIDFQVGRIYTFFLIVNANEMQSLGTIPAELYLFDTSLEQTKLDLAAKRARVIKKNEIAQKRKVGIN